MHTLSLHDALPICFGYDDMFYPHDSKLSFADMEAVEKLDYSHRGQALQKLIKKLRENGLLR